MGRVEAAAPRYAHDAERWRVDDARCRDTVGGQGARMACAAEWAAEAGRRRGPGRRRERLVCGV
eukprot:1697079-Prymnesium_polylepis.1